MVNFNTQKNINEDKKKMINKIVQNWSSVLFSDEKKTGVNVALKRDNLSSWTCKIKVKQGTRSFLKDHRTMGKGRDPIKATLSAIDNFTNAYVIRIEEQLK